MAMFRDNLSELKLIIIDEISMVSSDLLIGIHKKLSEIFMTDPSRVLYANKSMLVVGDVLQLPPVNGTFVFAPPKDKNLREFNDALPVWESFEPYVLRENHRQGDANVWANILNELRIGNVTEEALSLLKSRVTDQPFLDESAMHVFYTNAEVAEHNLNMLDRLNTEEYQIPATKIHPKWYTPQISKKDGSVDDTQYLNTLLVKVGARVSLVFNISLIDNLVNGSFGTIVGIETNKTGDKVSAIIVAFDDNDSGQKQREKYPGLSKKYSEQNGTPITRHNLEYQLTTSRGKKHPGSSTGSATVIQFPLRLAYASTGHKMQVSVLYSIKVLSINYGFN